VFVRKTEANGRTYYALVEGHRDEFGRVRQKVIVSLGKSPTLAQARKVAREQIVTDQKMRRRVLEECRGSSPHSVDHLVGQGIGDEEEMIDLPKWAIAKLNALDQRIAENKRRLDIISTVGSKLRADS
jgi:hypothetical protein